MTGYVMYMNQVGVELLQNVLLDSIHNIIHNVACVESLLIMACIMQPLDFWWCKANQECKA